MDGLFPHVAEKTHPSPPDQNLFTPPHSGRDGATTISSSERRMYNKALKAMYEIVRLGSKRLEQPAAEDEELISETVTETSETEDDVDGLYFYMNNNIGQIFVHRHALGCWKGRKCYSLDKSLCCQIFVAVRLKSNV